MVKAFSRYGWALSNQNVPSVPKWPFVSDTGGYPPESCLFTFFLVIASMITFLAIIIYYRYLIYQKVKTKLNKVSLIIGSIACLGIIVVGSFQYPAVTVVHIMGAVVAFACIIIYSWLNVYITYKHLSYFTKQKRLFIFRIVIVSAATASFLFFGLSLLLYKLGILNKNFPTISEWILIYSSIIFVFSLTFELCQVKNFQLQIKLIQPSSNSNFEDRNSETVTTFTT